MNAEYQELIQQINQKFMEFDRPTPCPEAGYIFSVERFIRRWNYFVRWNNGIGVDAGGVNASSYLARFAPLPEFRRVLSIGCGYGVEMADILTCGYEVTGLTLGENNVRFAKRVLGLDCFYQDAHATTLPDEFYDVIIACQTIEHILCIPLWLIECHRLLRPEGKIIIESPKSSIFSSDACTDDRAFHVLCPTPRQTYACLKMGGFENMELYNRDIGVVQIPIDLCRNSQMDNCDMDFVMVATRKKEHSWMPAHLIFHDK